MNTVTKEYSTVLTVSFKGVTSHAAAAPDYGRSAFDALLLSISAVERLRKHLPVGAEVNCRILSSGDVAPNVIPEFAQGEFVLASNDAIALRWTGGRICDIVNGAAQMTETEVEIKESELQT